MESEAQIVFKKMMGKLSLPPEDLVDIEFFLAEAVRDVYYEHTDAITEWVTSFNKVTNGATSRADTLIFQYHRVVVAYNYLIDEANYINIVVAVMKDFPNPNLSIRKALFLYDCKANMILKIDNEIPRP